MIQENLDHSDERKIRKSLLSVALITLVFSNLEFVSETIKILELEFKINQGRLVALGQISCFILLLAFVLRSSGTYLNLLKELDEKRLKRLHDAATNRWKFDWDVDVGAPSHEAHPMEEEYEAISRKFNYMKQEHEELFARVQFFFSAITVLVVDFGLPVFIGAFATFNPDAVSNLIDQLVIEAPKEDLESDPIGSPDATALPPSDDGAKTEVAP